jgi:lysophospholipase L1-like esterase
LKYYKYIFIFYITFCISNLFSQEDFPKYPFINYNVNHLYFSKDSSSFLTFYKKIEELSSSPAKKNKIITIAHIGGSHVQGGTWSNSFLNNLQNEFKTSGGGFFVFPYKIAKTNSQPYASSFTNGTWKKCRCVTKGFCLPLGMNGMSIKTNDSANCFGVSLTKRAICKSFNTVKVYHNFNSEFSFEISKKHNFQAEVIEKKELGYTQFNLEMPIDSISFELIRKDTLQKDFIIYGFSLENNLSNGFYLAGLGANGASSNSFLKCTYFEEQLKSIHPDLVVISLGVNDTQDKNFEKEEFIEHYDSLILAIKKASPSVAIILTTTTDNFIKRRTANKRSISAHAAMFELMQKHHIAVWDMFEFMGGYKSMMKWTKVGLGAKDRVHFAPKGYTILGYYMFEALIKSYYANTKK